jgi:hypothetical protein
VDPTTDAATPGEGTPFQVPPVVVVLGVAVALGLALFVLRRRT